jgi:predicted RNase H-like nuclease (RuvC/YqgF family)
MGLLTEERRSRSRLEAIVAQELLALRQDIAKCQRGNGNGGNSQFNNQGSLANDTKVLKEEISKLKRDHELLKTEVAGLMQNNTVLTDKVMELKRNLTTIQNMQSELTLRNETSHLEKELQITNNKLNAVTNEVDARKQDCIALSERFNQQNNGWKIVQSSLKLSKT